jgi:putative tricarboxylic transport membrane protein
MAPRLRAETFTAALMLALAGYIAYEGYDLGLGLASDPGSGYIQFWTGIIMAGLSTTLLIHSFLPGADTSGLGAPFAGIRWGKVLYVTALLVAYATVLGYFGFIITTFILLVVLFKTVEPQGWGVSLIGAVLTTGVAWLVFVYWLGQQLPTGSLLAGD